MLITDTFNGVDRQKKNVTYRDWVLVMCSDLERMSEKDVEEYYGSVV